MPQALVDRDRRVAAQVEAGLHPPRGAAGGPRRRAEPQGARAQRVDGSRTSSQKPSIATSPCSSTIDASSRARRHRRVRHRAARHPRVQRALECREHDVAPGETAERVGQAGSADAPVARVGEDEHVGSEVIGVLGQEGEQVRGAHLFLSFDQQFHVAGKRAGGVEARLDHRSVRDRARLVVGTAPAVEAAVVCRGLERVRLPAVLVPGRLHVVVRIEEDRRHVVSPAPRRVGPLGDHRRWAARNGGLAHRLEPARLEVRRRRVGRVLHVGMAVGVGADARDAHEILERQQCLVEAGVDRGRDVTGGVHEAEPIGRSCSVVAGAVDRT